jgi:DNA/RNA-binding domain of Phe-tRNA-synthetase-like protein
MTAPISAPLEIRFALDHPTLRLGVVQAWEVTGGPSDPRLLQHLMQAEADLRFEPTRFSEVTRTAVRDVLRKGGYKPTGRGKPASEFLLGAALDHGIPRISNLVDINNLMSLTHAHPISIFDAELLGLQVSIRFGREAEAYVFNPAGHQMDLRGLPVVCRGPQLEPVGNAVKDSMHCKVRPETRHVLAIVYGSSALPSALLEAACTGLAALLSEHAGAGSTLVQLLP